MRITSFAAMRSFAMILFVLISSAISAQTVSLLKLDKLEQRLKAGKDTVFIVNFWATWCVPCLEELPHFEKLASREKAKKLKVLLVSMDFRSKLQNTVVPFVRKSRLKNEVFLLDETNQQDYIDRIDPGWSGALPATLIISPTQRRFFETPFTYQELLTEYNKIHKP